MGVSLVALTGRTKATGEVNEKGEAIKAEQPMYFTAPNLLASNYPTLRSVVVKIKKVATKVAQVPVLPSEVQAPHFDTYEDAVSEAGINWETAALRLVNDAAKRTAKSRVSSISREMRVLDLANIGPSFAAVGQWVRENMFKAPEKKAGRQSELVTLIKQTDANPNMSLEEKYALLLAYAQGK